MQSNVQIYVWLFWLLLSCQTNNNANPSSNASNLNDMKNINKTDKRPLYALQFDASAEFQVYVNDILVAYHYGQGAANLTIPINREILGSGKQNVKISLRSDEKLDMNELKYYKFKVLKYDGFDSPDYEVIVECNFDVEKSKQLNEFSQSWDFTANVPYKVNGWLPSVNLLEEDKTKLLNEALKVYSDLAQILQQKDANSFIAKTEARDSEINTALYLSNSDIQKDKQQTIQTIQNISEVLPIDNYKMVFYGDGRMIALIKTNPGSKDESALQARLLDKSTEIFEAVLHRPTKGAALQIIR